MLKSSASKLFTVASLESYHLFFETPSLHYYLDILGVKPPDNDPKKIPVFSLDCFFARRHPNAVSAAGESTQQILFNLSVNCSVHMVKADTALIKSSSSRSATASKTLRTFSDGKRSRCSSHYVEGPFHLQGKSFKKSNNKHISCIANVNGYVSKCNL